MCQHGVYKIVNVINEQQNHLVKVDACIADEIQQLNNHGVITLGCCCGHGKAGEIAEWENAFGKWRSYIDPPHALIKKESVNQAKTLGYRPVPYHYSDGHNHDVWQIHLKTGCITMDDLNEWHNENKDIDLG